MSFVGSMLSNDKGSGFTAQGANVVAPTTAAQAAAGQQQIDKGNTQIQSGIDQQQNLVNALQAQGGLNNQSQVYNQLQGVANGTGPNPAQAMLAQQTGANVANQAALMAGQRGAGANAGLLARQAAAQGANTQQQAVGQGATMQANQSLNALGQAGALANQQAANQIGAVSGLNSAAQGAQGLNINAQGQTLGAIQGQNQANIQNTSQQNQANAEIAKGNQKGQQDLFGGLLSSAGSAATMLADGGEVMKMDDGGLAQQPLPPVQPTTVAPAVSGPKSKVGQFLSGIGKPQAASPQAASFQGANDLGNGLVSGLSSLFGPSATTTANPASPTASSGVDMMEAMGANPYEQQQAQANYDRSKMSKGGKVPAMVSPGEVYLDPKEVKEVAKGKKSPMTGEMIPGKAKVKGDSLENDTVPKTLEAGGVVIPRSVIQGPNAHREAYKFVNAVVAKHGMKAKGSKK